MKPHQISKQVYQAPVICILEFPEEGFEKKGLDLDGT